MSDDAPLAWPRAIAFGIVAGGMGVLGNDLVARTPTQPGMLLAGILFAMLVARPLAPLRIGAPTMVAGLVVLQTTIHLACFAVLNATSGAANAAHAHGHLVNPGGDLTSGGWPMLLAHAISLLLGSAVLLTLEQHAWDGVRRIARRVAGAVRHRCRPRRARCTAPDPRFLVHPRESRAAACRAVAHAFGTRGPPRACAPCQ